jgi:hypothetical protein
MGTKGRRNIKKPKKDEKKTEQKKGMVPRSSTK